VIEHVFPRLDVVLAGEPAVMIFAA
jgi:hypothetical protein